MALLTSDPVAGASPAEDLNGLLARTLPGFPTDLTATDSIRPGGRLAHGQLVAMRRILGSRYPTLVSEAVRLCETWGDLVELVGGHEPTDFRLGAEKAATGEGFTVRLRPLRQDDVPHLFEAAMDPADGFRWRLRGRTLSMEAFYEYLHEGVLAQFIVETIAERLPVGLVVAYNYVPDGGHCAVGVQRALTGFGQGGEMIEGVFLFLGHLVRSFPLRKMFFDLPGYNEYLVPREGGLLRYEGKNEEFYYHDGTLWDRLFYSVTADAFRDFEAKLYRRDGTGG